MSNQQYHRCWPRVSDVLHLHLLGLGHQHLPHTLRQRPATGLRQPAAQQSTATRIVVSMLIVEGLSPNIVKTSLASPGTEDTEQEELRPGRELAQHDHEGREDGAHPGQGGGEAQRGVADGRGEYLARDYVHNLDMDKRPIHYLFQTNYV